MIRAFHDWLHRRGIIRTGASTSSSVSERVEVRLESARWAPRRAVVWFGDRYLLRQYPSRARTHRLARIVRGHVTASGRRSWRLYYEPAGGVWDAPVDRRTVAARHGVDDA